MVYEIQMGMVDRGADLSWLSQVCNRQVEPMGGNRLAVWRP